MRAALWAHHCLRETNKLTAVDSLRVWCQNSLIVLFGQYDPNSFLEGGWDRAQEPILAKRRAMGPARTSFADGCAGRRAGGRPWRECTDSSRSPNGQIGYRVMPSPELPRNDGTQILRACIDRRV